MTEGGTNPAVSDAHLGNTYGIVQMRSDLFAAISVTAVAVPTAMAYAELAGFAPVIGLYASILPLVAYACLGSSPQLIVGPDAATCTIVASALVPLAAQNPERYVALSITLSLIVGLMCVGAGLLRFGVVADFLSRPILSGFMNGIALTIVSKQLGDLCGVGLVSGTGFFRRVADFLAKLDQVHAPTLLVGSATLALIWGIKRLAPRFPAPFVGVLGGVGLAAVFDLEKSTVALVGALPSGFPSPTLPAVSLDDIQTLSFYALGVMIVSFCSAIATAKSFAARNGYEVNASREFIALGAANLASAASGGFAVSGADSRTAISDTAGGKTRMTGIYAAALMTIVLLFLTGPLELIPKSTLAAILIFAGASLFSLTDLLELYRVSRREFWVAIVATLGVIMIGVAAGIIIAVVLTIVTLLMAASRPHDAVLGRISGTQDFSDVEEHPCAQQVPGVIIYRFDASLLFFNAGYFKHRVRTVVTKSQVKPRSLLFDAEAVTMIDVTAAHAFKEIRFELEQRGISVAIACARTALREQFYRLGLLRPDVDPIYPSIESGADALITKFRDQQSRLFEE
jgi:high affinity sulfate transporter 1